MCTSKVFGLIIGYIEIVAGIISVIACIYMFVRHDKIADHTNMDTDILLGLVSLFFCMTLVSICISILMVTGIHKQRPGFILPWIVMSVISIVNCFIINIVMSIHGQQLVNGIIGGLIGVGIQCAIIYPIYTFYKHMKAENTYGTRRGIMML